MQINILIVDDVKANLISLEALLETISENYNIIKANSGIEALEITLSQVIDLIILDIQMPYMDGFEVAQLLKSNKKTADIPVIFLTAAFKSDEWIHKGFELGAVDYLTKPIDENQFINRISLYTKLIHTIDDNRKKDEILHSQSKMASMGEMIGNIAHQWRQPLSVISTASTGIQLQKECNCLDDKFLNDMLEQINNSAQFLSDTINEFSEFLNNDTQKEDFNISKYLEKALNIEEEMIIANSIKIIKDIDESLIAKNYANLFIHIIINIINNSSDAFKSKDIDEKYIFIELKKDNNKVVINIKDNGGGIDEDILPNIFDPYFTTKHQSQGTGLGLYMTYNMVENMDGTISAKNCIFEYNNKEYKGAEFHLEF
ncbi:MAG: hybrid sensor histidine kinase/response regulator [Campylobacterota bacterium]|nr:hybrid sensor histidine kinase/response regulator [Campylobacterota bacterium]